MEIDVLIEAPEWDALDLEGLAQAACIAALRDLSLNPTDFSLSILACDDARIATLNGDFRAKPTPTNVLSWPAEDRAPDTPGAMPDLEDLPNELGDLALAFETCAREARDGGKPLAHHLSHLLVHGLLHCLGFDHETDADADLMEATETRILARLGVPDPY
ncbi:rRNA maturation RNase YbeY [Gymnodinialimonas sp.]